MKTINPFQQFTSNQLSIYLKFEDIINNSDATTEILFKDPAYINFLDKVVFNILDKETYTYIMENIKHEKIFYESFYLAFKLIGRNDWQGVKDLKYFEIAQNYLHYTELYDHYFVLDYFIEIY